MTRAQRIAAILTRELAPHHLQVTDDSAKHAGHAGASPAGQTHYTVTIESAAFVGKNKVQRHQMVYALLSDEFKTGLHALAIAAKAPGEE